MPHLPFANNDAAEDELQHLALKLPEHEPRKRKNSVLGRIQKIGNWFKDDEPPPSESLRGEEERRIEEEGPKEDVATPLEEKPARRPSLLGRRGYRRAVPELPRPLTFRRQNSEKRDRLLPIPAEPERRAVSADRRPRSFSRKRTDSPPLTPLPSLSAPEVGTPVPHNVSPSALQVPDGTLDLGDSDWPQELPHEPPNLPIPGGDPPPVLEDDEHSDVLDERELQAELESKWILNLSMHFRDKSDREKFFVTYAQEPNRWRRVTVSLDYREADQESLEADLRSLHYQRDKSARIYEAVRDSLPDIQFFDTVTNLKLQTDEGRLHVHVTEDINEIINYPPTSLVEHINCNRYCERDLEFDAHLSGFVYRVRVNDQVLIKKEIPGPDTVDEFLYEINALDALQDSSSVIKFHGLVIDEECSLVKGLLISFAPRGPLVDMLYDYKGTDQLPWERRERWAYQIIEGLSEIHEAGFVQGDFTLSNIVIDGNDDAKIIDINRRGCPVGWEPPELISLIHSGQRIGMCIGVKSDLFQLGMVLWALAEKADEPENVERLDNRLPPVSDEETPLWFRRLVEVCLSEKPRDRLSGKELLYRFPPLPPPEAPEVGDLKLSDHSIRSRRSDKQYIDPAAAVHLEDIEEHRREHVAVPPSHLTSEPFTLVNGAPSTNYRYQSDGSYIVADRDENQPSLHRRRSSPYARVSSSATSVSSRDAQETRPRRRAYEYVCTGDDEEDDDDVEDDADDDGDATPAEDHGGVILPMELGSLSLKGPRHKLSRTSAPGKYTRFASDLDSSEGAGVKIESEAIAPQDARQENSCPTGPPHQDSGFDEQMIAGIESSDQLGLSTQSYSPELDLDSQFDTAQPDLITAALQPLPPTLPQSKSHSQSQSQSRFQSAQPQPQLEVDTNSGYTFSAGEQSTSHSPPEPLTPFSYHTPLTSPLIEAKPHAVDHTCLSVTEPEIGPARKGGSPAAL